MIDDVNGKPILYVQQNSTTIGVQEVGYTVADKFAGIKILLERLRSGLQEEEVQTPFQPNLQDL